LAKAIDSFGNHYLLGVFENKADAEKAFDAWNKEYEQALFSPGRRSRGLIVDGRWDVFLRWSPFFLSLSIHFLMTPQLRSLPNCDRSWNGIGTSEKPKRLPWKLAIITKTYKNLEIKRKS